MPARFLRRFLVPAWVVWIVVCSQGSQGSQVPALAQDQAQDGAAPAGQVDAARSWNERRAELESIDMASLSDDELSRVLRDLRPWAGPEDPLARALIGRAAGALAKRLADRGDVAVARGVLEQGLNANPDASAERTRLLAELASLALDGRDFDEARLLVERARTSLTDEQRAVGLDALLDLLQGRVDLARGAIIDGARAIASVVQRARQQQAEGEPADSILLSAEVALADAELALGRLTVLRDHARTLLAEAERMRSTPTLRAHLWILVGLSHELEGPPSDVEAGAWFRRALEDEAARDLDRVHAHVHLAWLAQGLGDAEGAREHLAKAWSEVAELGRRGSSKCAPEELALMSALDCALERAAQPGDEHQRSLKLDTLRKACTQLLSPRSGALAEAASDSLVARAVQISLSEWIEAEHDLDGSEEALERVVRALARAEAVDRRTRTFGGAADGWQDFGAGEVRAALVPTDGALLVYLPAPRASHVLAITAQGWWVERLGDARLVRERCAAFEHSVQQGFEGNRDVQATQRRRTELGRASMEVAAALFPGEVGRQLGSWRSLNVVVSRELLGAVSIESLPVAGRPLGARAALACTPSVALAVELARRRPRAPAEQVFARDLTLLTEVELPNSGSPMLAGLRELPFDPAWTGAWVRSFEPERVELLRGTRATLAGLLGANAANARMLHVFTYGVRDPGHAGAAALWVTPDERGNGLVTATDLAGLRSPPLVILSACGPFQAAASDVEQVGYQPFVEAFLRGGADAVIASESNSSFRSTALLTQRISEALTEGATPAEAVRAARAALLERPDFDDPFHYGATRVWGLAQRPLFPDEELTARADRSEPRSNQMRALAAGATLCLGALLVMRSAARRGA